MTDIKELERDLLAGIDAAKDERALMRCAWPPSARRARSPNC
jgi:hypothetical protein